MIFAILSAGGVVQNIIVASQSFVDQYYRGAIRIDLLSPMPGIGWNYFKGQFSPPQN